MVTIATHNGSVVHQDHNIRNPKVASKEQHIDPNGVHETWVHIPVREAYNELFADAVKRYNDTQKREDRKISNYYNKICKDPKQHPAYEMIIGIYGENESGKQQCPDALGKEIMREFVDTWQERNPNLVMIGAYYHADEEGSPHVHIDYVPVAHGYARGMDTQAGLVRALGEQGLEMVKVNGKSITAQIQWEKQENDYLTKLCEDRGLCVVHPKLEHSQHLDTETYKAEKHLETLGKDARQMIMAQDDLKLEIGRLEAKRNIAEHQAEKALERKAKAFSKSYKKDSVTGWNYNKTLYDEIKEIVQDRKADAEQIGHTDLDVEAEWYTARYVMAETEEEKRKIQQNKENQDELIKSLARNMAEKQVRQYIEKEFAEIDTQQDRLAKYCSEIHFNDGMSVLDKFQEQEKLREQKLLQELERKQKHHISHGWDR